MAAAATTDRGDESSSDGERRVHCARATVAAEAVAAEAVADDVTEVYSLHRRFVADLDCGARWRDGGWPCRRGAQQRSKLPKPAAEWFD